MAVEIDISNYESYLLSYVDNELDDAEQAALEQFLQQHPHIRAELELLKGACVVPDEQVVFDQKAALYRHTPAAATEAYESMMLSYVDGELPAEDTVRLKSWLREHPEAQKEMALLQVVKLEPDTTVVFANKASLYRTSRKTVRMAAYWWGATAAAVLTGLLIWLLPAGDRHNSQPIAGTVTKEAMTPQAGQPETAAVPAPAPEKTETPAAPYAEAARPEAAHMPASRTASSRKKETARAKVIPTTPAPQQPQNNNAVASAAATADAPVISALPSPRNTSDEVVEKHLQQNTTLAAAAPADNTPAAGHAKEAVIAANMPAMPAKAPAPVAAAPAPAAVKGELILSVSGSDSRILDKVTNVAKFFSRKRNK
ncbi:hypothetical protein HF324_24280 [Chitinophaga oryzae]|uniref:Zinc-finger domain-containing protein n=1 Tax=Chitinophaga oryzae TaxID=2725414 RepID=A0ABX6LL43_9BACT|nr:hypothetical protein [Chitinophaga oryzae]QJB40786.1 hypothetical protein HF324_24280 [Chitinophaga oryzae]